MAVCSRGLNTNIKFSGYKCMYICLDINDMYPVPPEPAANRNNRCFFPLSFPTPLSLLFVQGITVNYLSLRITTITVEIVLPNWTCIELGDLGGWEQSSWQKLSKQVSLSLSRAHRLSIYSTITSDITASDIL